MIEVLEDLPAAPLKACILKTWLPAVAEGKTVTVKGSRARMCFKAAEKDSAKFRLSLDFVSKHRGLSSELRKIAAKPTSKWDEVGSGGIAIRDLHGFRSFLVRVQRRPFVCGVAGLTSGTPKMRGAVSRYGRLVAA